MAKATINVCIQRTSNLVIFIHGRGKSSQSWNETESGKIINIAKQTQEIANIIMIDMDETDYSKPINVVCSEIISEIKALTSILDVSQKVFIVSHSIGSFYATNLMDMILDLRSDGLFGRGLLYIDPTCKTVEYCKQLKERGEDTLLESLDKLPIFFFPNKIMIKVHLVVNEDLLERISCFEKMVKGNMMSEIVVHPLSSHMLHWDQSDKFIHLIKSMIVQSNLF